jgi:O-antigen ligase
MFIENIFVMLLPYMAGKLLIEQGGSAGDSMRRKLVNRVVTLLAVVSLLSIPDFLLGGSIWQRVGGKLFPGQFGGSPPQMRWGFGRIQGAYNHAILAGMMFLMGLIFCLWLRSVDRGWGTRKLIAGLPVTVRGLVLTAIAGGLLMTQSRGPWMGVVLALLFVLLTRVLSVGRAIVAFLLLVSALSVGAYHFGNQYTNKDLLEARTEEQQNAIYRRMLITNYMPLVMERKAFGWGTTTFPAVMGQRSIDNEYLFLAITQGFAGLGLYLMIMAGNAGRLFGMLARPLRQEDKLLVFAHLSVLIGLMVTITTVYMGQQVMMMFFLLTGWVQSIKPAAVQTVAINPFVPQQGFQRVLV